MKKRKLLSSILIILSLILATFVSSANSSFNYNNNIALAQKEALDDLKRIEELFGQDPEKYDFDSYAGAFIDDEGILNISFVGERGKALKDKTTDTKIKYHSVKYSKKELVDKIEYLSKNIVELGISTIELDEKNNKIVICYDTKNKQKADELTQPETEDMVEIKILNQNIMPTNTVEMRCGTDILTESGYYTLSFGAIDNSTGKKGFVTAGHLNAVGDTVDKVALGTVGTIKKQKFSGSVDACFIQRKEPFLGIGTFWKAVKDTIYGNYYDIATSNYLVQGQTVFAYGSVSKNQSGEILSTNFSFVVEGVTLTNMVKSDYVAIPGDSGAPVIFYSNHTTGIRHNLCGNQSSSNLGPNYEWIPGVSWSAFSRIENILSDLNISTYSD